MSNQSPTDLNLSNSRIREHQPIDTVIGEFITTDPDTGNTFTYTLVPGDDSTDNNSFTIENNQLKTNAIFDYETKNSYNIRVRTTDQDGLSFEKVLTINIDNVNEASLPIIKNPISDLTVLENAANTNIDLLAHFDDPLTTGQVARFELYNTDLAGGIINVLLFDQAESGAPLTVDNFINYAEDDDYVNSIIHRSVPGFVIQGGGFTINNLEVSDVPDDPAVQNEFSSDRSNLRGTIAMAKLGNNPNSATNQWFFNLEDNSSNLDNQNGGFTVFGEVLSQNDLAVIDEIATVPIFNGRILNSAFGNLPLQIDPNNPRLSNDEEFIIFRDITVTNLDELTFSIVSNSNPSLVDVSIDNNKLIIDYLDEETGTAEIIIRGTSLLGYKVEDAFIINVNNVNETPINITLNNNTVDENEPINTEVGTFTTTDPDTGETFTYYLVTGDGDTDNSLFTIDGDVLKTNAIFDFETQDTYSIRVQTTDSENNTYSEALIINVNDIVGDDNVAPEGLQFNVIFEGNTLNLTNAWIRDENGYQDVSYVDLWVRKDGEAWKDIADITNFEPWENDSNWAIINHQINFSDYEYGTYQIWARGYDQQGLESNTVSQTFDFFQENIAPEQLQFNVSVEGNTLKLTNAWIRDENGYQNLSYVDLWIKKDGGSWQNIADITNFEPRINDNDSAGINHEIDFSYYQSGSYQIWARGYDQEGLESNIVSQTFDFFQENTPPSQLQFQINQQNYQPTETLVLDNAWIYDEDGPSDVAKVDFWVQKPDGNWIDVSDVNNFTPQPNDNDLGGFEYSLDLRELRGSGVGEHTLWGQAEDQSGDKSNVVTQTFVIDNIAPSPTGLDGYFDIDAQVYTSNDTLNINNGWVRDLNGVADIQRIDFWLRKEGEAWQDIEDVSGDEITPWSQDSTWGSFDFGFDLTGLTPGNYTLWSGVQDQELANNGTWANIVQNRFEIQA
ncbi:MAG: peptidylprolyl isomerase [Crocosphaera sp.]